MGCALTAGGLILYVLCCLPAAKRRLAPGALIALKVLSIALEILGLYTVLAR